MSVPITVTLNPAIDKTVTVNKLDIGGLNRVVDVRVDPGGKGINVARVLSNLQVQVKATGFIAGAQGRKLLQELKDEQMNIDFLEVEGETRTNIKIVEAHHKTTTEINEQGFQITSQQLQDMKEKLTSIVNENASYLVLGGSFPPGVPETIYQEYILLAKSKGVEVILDADGVALAEGMKAKPFAIKPNLFELEQLVGRSLNSEEEIVSAGKELINKGISIVLISMGSKGAIILDQDEAFRTEPFPITPQSTVGAGDSMVGALVYALLQKKTLPEIALWTTAAGTITASKPGTQVCTLEEIQASLSRVYLSKI